MNNSTWTGGDDHGEGALSEKERAFLDAYWRAANYLSVGRIYLYDNPLLKKPLTKEHVKPRLLCHWGTTPGLNFIYAHMERIDREHDLDMGARARPRPSQAIRDKRIEHKEYIGRHGDDMPEITGWKWGQESVSGGVRSTEADNA